MIDILYLHFLKANQLITGKKIISQGEPLIASKIEKLRSLIPKRDLVSDHLDVKRLLSDAWSENDLDKDSTDVIAKKMRPL